MDQKATIHAVRLGAKTFFELPADGKFDAPAGFVITQVDVEDGAIYCKPLQIDIETSAGRTWVTINPK